MSDEGDANRDRGPLQGHYANYFQVGHNAFEFVLEFGQQLPGREAPALHTRVFVNPAYAKAFLGVLTEALEAYRQSFGEIPDADAGGPEGGQD